jgi:hypothetical protein
LSQINIEELLFNKNSLPIIWLATGYCPSRQPGPPWRARGEPAPRRFVPGYRHSTVLPPCREPLQFLRKKPYLKRLATPFQGVRESSEEQRQSCMENATLNNPA